MFTTVLEWGIWFMLLGIVVVFIPTTASYPLPDFFVSNVTEIFGNMVLFLEKMPILRKVWDFVQLWLIFWSAMILYNLGLKALHFLPGNHDWIDKLKIK